MPHHPRRRREEEAHVVEAKSRRDLEERDGRLLQLQKCLDSVEAQLVVETDKARSSASQQLKSLVERLKIQLASKEKQHQVCMG